MNTIRKFSFLTIIAVLFILPTTYLMATDNNAVALTAQIGKGSCSFSTNTDTVEFKNYIVNDFKSGDAVGILPLKLLYQCEGYDDGLKATVSISGMTPQDTRVFLSGPSTTSGVGFMLKDGSMTETTGFYNAGTTLLNGGSFVVNAVAQGEHIISIGFVKQNTTSNVTSGNANAAVTFTFELP
ncbi:fimbrial protein [Pragia fontium]|uniref:fimbrial protein n=1 Tax=Pragia fontium TaxID=82985 RepID=UPI000DF8D29A|nr:fimbrial protein [Pragia fontium]SUB82593.1 P pilus assembly protein, pilin FimA [Pragia fontium]VEJ55493.1 P pilus assembly protein, pilin FimA [Pragia fontium]